MKPLFIYTVFNREGHRVARYSDIDAAFTEAVKPAPRRGFTVMITDFIKALKYDTITGRLSRRTGG